jgi:glucose-6-phosphate isomerase, archaeal
MTDLTERAGIDIRWSLDGSLSFDAALVVDETFPRPRGRLRPVALEPDTCEPADQTQYWMYNGIARIQERERLLATGMRYELTLMFPHALGRERAKTLGHLHSFPPNSAINYPEVCEVLHGSAYFVFQAMDTRTKDASFCAVLEAHPGDKVIIPPNLHHLTINAGDEPLLFSDVIPLDVKGIYQPLMDMHGAAYLYTFHDGWIRNPAYRTVPTLEHWEIRRYPELSPIPDAPLYQVFAETPDLLAWMLTPARFGEFFPDLWAVVRATTIV